MYNPPNEMHKPKFELLNEFVKDLTLPELEAALVEGKMSVIYKKIKGTDNVEIREGYYRRIKELSARLEEVRKLV